MQETLPFHPVYTVNSGFKGFQLARKQLNLDHIDVLDSVNSQEHIQPTLANQVGKGGRLKLDSDHLPAKVLENSQRTARVIIISELEKRLNREKKLKTQLHKILSEFIPKQMTERQEYAEANNYYKSLNYSRVRIGHKQFIKKILNNSGFYKYLSEIFDDEGLCNSQKVRKNERSPISFEQRKLILMQVVQDYKAKFFSLYHLQEMCNENSTILDSYHIMEAKEASIQILVPMTVVMSPLIPIPLKPAEYQKYMASKKLSSMI